MATDVLGIRPV